MSYEGTAISPSRLPVATGSAFGAIKSGSNITNTAGVVSLTAGNVTSALTFTPENLANKNAVSGYAGLDASSLLTATQLPFATGAIRGAIITGSNITNTAGTISLTNANITGAQGYTSLNRAGDTMTGLLILSGDAVSALGAATLQQVQAAQAGLGLKAPVKLATVAALSPTNTYANGAAGVGATLTATAVGTLTVDGVLTAAGDRILVKNETGVNNGIYVVSTAGSAGTAYVLTRSSDMNNTVVDAVSNFQYGAYALVELGSTQAGTPYAWTGGVGTGIPGTTTVTWNVFSVPNTGVTSIVANTSGLQVSAATGAVTLSFSSQTASFALLAPVGSAGAPTFRAIVAADLPTATNAALGVAQAGTGLSVTTGIFSVNFATALRTVRVVTAAGAVTCTSADDVVLINKTTGAATAVTLPATPATGEQINIKDAKGDASVNLITVSPATGTVDGSASVIIDQAYGARSFVYNGTEWNLV